MNEENNNLKLGLGIMCWEDPTWLYPICRELRPIASHITIGWQHYSYSGKELDNDTLMAMYKELDYLKERGLIDDIIFIPNACYVDSNATEGENYIIASRNNEYNKRNQLHNHITQFDCDYIMICDSDEFHFIEDVRAGMVYMRDNDLDTSFSEITNFVKSTKVEYHLHDMTNFLASAKLISPFVLTQPVEHPMYDATRMYKLENAIHFDSIYCYHFPYIRRKLINKYKYYSQPCIFANHTEETFLRDYTLDEVQILKDGYVELFGMKFPANPCVHPILDNKLLNHLISRD